MWTTIIYKGPKEMHEWPSCIWHGMVDIRLLVQYGEENTKSNINEMNLDRILVAIKQYDESAQCD